MTLEVPQTDTREDVEWVVTACDSNHEKLPNVALLLTSFYNVKVRSYPTSPTKYVVFFIFHPIVIG